MEISIYFILATFVVASGTGFAITFFFMNKEIRFLKGWLTHKDYDIEQLEKLIERQNTPNTRTFTPPPHIVKMMNEVGKEMDKYFRGERPTEKSLVQLQKDYQKAIDNEEYEAAEKIKKQIDDAIKNTDND